MNFMNNISQININQNNNEPVIIGTDHGYGNIKTAHCCFKTGVSAYDKEPTFKSNLLVYGGKYYLIGEGAQRPVDVGSAPTGTEWRPQRIYL